MGLFQHIYPTMKFTKCGTINIKGYEWEYGFGDAGKTKGIPDDAACSYKRRKIIISPEYTRSLIEIVSHEVAHAYFPKAKEKTILEFGDCVEEVFRGVTNPTRR